MNRFFVGIALIGLSVVLLFGFVSQSGLLSVTNSLNTKGKYDTTQALRFLRSQCLMCHAPAGSVDTRIAPPIEHVKAHYIDSTTTKEQFVNDVALFVKHPSKKKSLMPGALRKFNLMPTLNYNDNDVRAIAALIFDLDLENENWYKLAFSSIPADTVPNSFDVESGRSFAMATKTVLGKNLMQAIQTKGTIEAIEFCSTRAIPLTDSMAAAQSVSIKRVSDKVRNPKNKATKGELAILDSFKKERINTGTTTPRFVENSKKAVGYYAIETNAMCLQCHGVPEKDILLPTLKAIRATYPKDKAIGYSEHQIRGMFVVEHKKK